MVKDSSLMFTVTHVNGKRSETAVEFNVAQVDFSNRDKIKVIPAFKDHQQLIGQIWTLIVCETRFVRLTPNEYDGASPVFPLTQTAYYSS